MQSFQTRPSTSWTRGFEIFGPCGADTDCDVGPQPLCAASAPALTFGVAVRIKRYSQRAWSISTRCATRSPSTLLGSQSLSYRVAARLFLVVVFIDAGRSGRSGQAQALDDVQRMAAQAKGPRSARRFRPGGVDPARLLSHHSDISSFIEKRRVLADFGQARFGVTAVVGKVNHPL